MTTNDHIGDSQKKVARVYDLIGTSFHEAGHAIFALSNYMQVKSVYVFESKEHQRILGQTNNIVPIISTIENQQLRTKLLSNEIGLNYAGYLAEKHHFQLISGSEKIPKFIKEGFYDDRMVISELIKQFNPAPPGQKRANYKQKIIRHTLAQLKENWEDLTMVAHEIFRKKRLSADDLKDLLLAQSENKKDWKERFRIAHQIYDLGGLDEELLVIKLLS